MSRSYIPVSRLLSVKCERWQTMTEEVMWCHVSRVTPVSLWQEACHTQDTDLSICSSPHEENICCFPTFSCLFSFLCFVNYKFKFTQQTFPVIQMQKILTLDDIKICEFERVKWVYWEKYVIGRVGCDRCYIMTRTMPLSPASLTFSHSDNENFW